MPFFFTPGEQDIGNRTMLKFWNARRGVGYYNFVYKNVLFLVLCTEDPPEPISEKMIQMRTNIKELMESGQHEKAEQLTRKMMALETPTAHISDVQLAYFKKAIADNKGVNWTFVLMHKPVWQMGLSESSGFTKIETMLSDRAYTVFAGHQHFYNHQRINDRRYITLGATGAASYQAGPGDISHVTLVSVSHEGPVIGNIMLDGIKDVNLR
jgi:hypothetical protein